MNYKLLYLKGQLEDNLNWEPDYEAYGLQTGPDPRESYELFKEIRKIEKEFPIPRKLYYYIKEYGDEKDRKLVSESIHKENLPKQWRTKEGKVLYIQDMETNHIENCIKKFKENPSFGRHKEAFELELKRRK